VHIRTRISGEVNLVPLATVGDVIVTHARVDRADNAAIRARTRPDVNGTTGRRRSAGAPSRRSATATLCGLANGQECASDPTVPRPVANAEEVIGDATQHTVLFVSLVSETLSRIS